MIEHELFERSTHNPLIKPSDIPYPCDCVCNPAAIKVNGETVLLLRVIDQEGSSHITVARSADGLTNWRIDDKPLLAPGDRDLVYETYGCEDPRVVYLEDRQEYAITYTGFSPLGASVCLALSKDFRTAHRLGLILPPNNKDGSLFPRQINGKYHILHRPALGSMEHIWVAESDNLIYWGRPWVIIEERGGPWWDGEKVGGGPPPIETAEGWLIIYHGVQQTSHGPIYRVGLALLELENPRKVIRRLPRWVFGPKAEYESTGLIPGVVFPTGTTVDGDDIRLYYGAADTRIAVAEGKISVLLDALRKEGK